LGLCPQTPTPNPQSPIPNPQSPLKIHIRIFEQNKNLKSN